MDSWKNALQEGLVSGSLASVLSSAALVALGKRETGHAAAPTNAVSHWLWGRKALRQNAPTARYTLVGYVIHHGASVMWATLFARLRPRGKQAGSVVVGAAATSAIAAFVDFELTPERLTPGFEHRLGAPALVVVYACFAAGLAVGTIALALSNADDR